MYMAYAKTKNKRRVKTHSAKSRFLSIRHKTPIQKLTLAVIILAIFTVIIAVICALIFDTERAVKSTISSLATDYYENYFYENISTGNKDMTKTMEKFADTGFSKVTLRQLLLYNQQNSNYKDLLLKHCDENTTSVTFYPESPYSKTSYRTEYSYSCSF